MPSDSISDRRARALFESVLEGYCYCQLILDEGRPIDWICLDVNPAFTRLTGLTGVVGRRFSEVLPSLRQDNPELLEAYGRVVESGTAEQLELYFPALANWFSVSAFRPEEGCFVAIFENITDRKRADEALREAMARYASVINTSTDAIFINRGGRVVLVNPACLRLFGAEREDQLLGKSPFDLIHADYHGLVRERISDLFERWDSAPPVEQKMVRLDGTTVDVEVVAAPFLDHGERAVHVMVRDISDRKRVEEELQHQQALLREAGELAHVGGWEFDPTSGQGTWTEETARIHDLDPSLGTSTQLGMSFYHGESRLRLESAILEAATSGKPYDLGLELTSAKGVLKHVRTICHPQIQAGRVVRMRGAIQDISAQVAAEQELAAERSRLRTVLDTIPDLVWLKDPAGAYLSCNRAFERLMGAPEAALAGHTDYDFVDRELADSFRFHDKRALEVEGSVINEEWVTLPEGGARVLLETIKTPVKDPHGRVLGVLGIARDVTQARATAEALRQSEERLRLFIEHAPVALAMFDRDMRYISASRRWCTDYNLDHDLVLGHSHYEVFPEIGEAWRSVHQRALRGEIIRAEEDQFERRDGSALWLRWEVRPWRDASGEVAGILIFTEDISERKGATEALAESEAHFRALAETTFDWIWEVDAEARYTFVSPRVQELLGYAPTEVLGRTPFSLMPPNEAARVGAAFASAAARFAALTALESVHRHKDGRLVVLESSGVPYFGPAGEFRGYRGMNRDVTARKQAERRSATQAAISRVLAESASLVEAATRVLAAIGQGEGWPHGTMWATESDSRSLNCIARWASAALERPPDACPPPEACLARGEGFAGQVWARGEPCLSPELTADTSMQVSGSPDGRTFGRAIGFPVFVGDDVIAVVEFGGTQTAELGQGLLEMFEAIGRQLGLFVERRRATTAMERFVSGSPAVIYALRVQPERLSLVWLGGNLEKMTGWNVVDAGAPSWWLDNIHPEDRERVVAAHSLPYEVDHQALEFRFRRRDGHYLWVHDEKRLLHDATGRPQEIVGSWTDVTDRVQLEDQLRVSQKLEAIGRLAGGVAHDFNNLLTVINGNGELLSRALPAQSPEGVIVAEIREAAERAAALTRQLLAFSRSQVLAPQVVELDSVVRRVETMLRRLIGEDVTLVCELSQESIHVFVDPGQLEQVIVNLAVNARDAMPRGGKLVLSSETVAFDTETCPQQAGLQPGDYARLVVRDNGCGMSPAVRERIFEPFFTTKPQGQGTGLGLATVFGILTQSGGHIEVESEEGVGSTFSILLPRVLPVVAPPNQTRPNTAETRGRETVLLVEDEPGVRRIARIALERAGYTVLCAANGREALALAEEHGETIDLLLTDLVMPEMSGRELVEALRVDRPGLVVLLMSGYVEDDMVRHGVVEAEMAFLHKPFSLAELAAKVRSVLDGRATT